MRQFLKWLKWYFVPHGVVYREENLEKKPSWWDAFKRLMSGAVIPRKPTVAEQVASGIIKKKLKRQKCPMCGLYFWGWKRSKHCGRWCCAKET